MINDSDTVREVYERTVGYNQMCSFGHHEKETVKRIADNFLSAHEREMAKNDEEIARLNDELFAYAGGHVITGAERCLREKVRQLEAEIDEFRQALKREITGR